MLHSTTESLWEQAVAKLGPDDRNVFDFGNLDKLSTLSEVIKVVEAKRDECIDKQWKFRRENGEELVLRDFVDGLLIRLKKYAVIGDIAIQHSPGSGVALAWAGFRFLLQVSFQRAF